MTTEIYIAENIKYKIAAFLINLFLIFGLWLVPDSDILLRMPAWYNQMDIYLTVLLSFPLTWQLNSLFKKTGIRLHPKGFENSIGLSKAYNFSWDEIVKIQFFKIYFLKYILVYIKDPNAYVKKQSFLKKWSMRADLKRLGTPVKIPIQSINKSPQEIMSIITNYVSNIKSESVPL